MTDDTLTALLTELVQSNAALTKAQIALTEKVLDLSVAQASMMQDWMSLWKPPQRDPVSTSLDERLFKKEADAATDWIPLTDIESPSDFFKRLDADVPFRDLDTEF